MSDLRKLLEDYLTLRRSRGYKLERAGLLLPHFVAFLESRGSASITSKFALEWATQPPDVPPKWWAQRLGLVRAFAKYTQAFDGLTEIPSHSLIPYQKMRPEPYVYSDDDRLRLLDAARALPGPLMGATYTTFLGLLAVTGMRVDEAIQLDRRDVDCNDGVLTVRMGKFGKSRELPVHHSTVRAMKTYSLARDRLFRHPPTPSFFVSQAGTRLIYQNVHLNFHGLIDEVGLSDRRPHRPRIHDLRHTFAIRTVIGWYKSGVDIEPRMPLLSTYMGHFNPKMTYWYLTATPELLALAQERAERAQRSQS